MTGTMCESPGKLQAAAQICRERAEPGAAIRLGLDYIETGV